MSLLLFFAALAGLITVLSPCILPILPILLAGGIDQDRKKPYGIILGVIFSFSFFTLSLTALVHATGISPNFLRYIALVVIIFFGCTLLFPKLEQWFTAKTAFLTRIGGSLRDQSAQIQQGFGSGFVLGVALGLIWAPCAGPILGSITTLVASNQITLDVVYVTLAYSIGAALPMFFIAYFGNKIIDSIHYLSGYSELIRKFFGILMIGSALAILFHVDIWLQQLTVRYFPNVELEKKLPIQKELEKLAPQKNKAFLFTSENSTPKAPEFVGIDQWLNSPPLTMHDLEGKVVLVDFWTYSCINCVRTFPYLKSWYATYKDKGFVIVGVHTPEFEFEKNIDNIKNALHRFGLTYPVAVDNEYKTWQNYNNSYWPAHYLVNQQGYVVEKHFGEGSYLETENAIRHLLGLEPLPEIEKNVARTAITPETYLGYARGFSYTKEISLKNNEPYEYSYTKPLLSDRVGLKGTWLVHADSIEAKTDDCVLELNFIATRVYLVMQANKQSLINVQLDGNPLPSQFYTADMNQRGQILVHEPRMYSVLNLQDAYGRHTLTLTIPAGVTCYVFTFGSNETGNE